MGDNPWQVESIQDFVYLNCPECSFKTKEETHFHDHAVSNHPMCFVLFNQVGNGNEIVIQEVEEIEDQKPQYFIEVNNTEEAPSKIELAEALASIEEPIEKGILELIHMILVPALALSMIRSRSIKVVTNNSVFYRTLKLGQGV